MCNKLSDIQYRSTGNCQGLPWVHQSTKIQKWIAIKIERTHRATPHPNIRTMPEVAEAHLAQEKPTKTVVRAGRGDLSLDSTGPFFATKTSTLEALQKSEKTIIHKCHGRIV